MWTPKIRRTGLLTGFVALMAIGTVGLIAAGQSFLFLQSGFTQDLVGVTQMPDDEGFASVLGGIAFAPDGDIWVADCFFSGTRLHRFDVQTTQAPVNGTSTIHPETTVQTEGGCGLTNHPSGFLFSNSSQGVWKLDASSGLPAAGPNPVGPFGNALGITSDPQTGHVVYAGDDCHPSLVPGATTCTLYDLDPVTNLVTIFAQMPHDVVPYVDGIYFEPAGTYLFMANRGQIDGQNFLTILSRPAAPVVGPSTDQIVQSVPMTSEPDGVSFHATSPKFVITNDETNGTMTRFDFPGDNYTMVPDITTFASGGFRGDLTQVGPDGCIYATQGRNALASDSGARYDDGTTTIQDSVVKICATGGGGFAIPPGVSSVPTTHLTLVKTVVNGNGGTAVPADFTLTATGPTTISGPGGVSADVGAGTYTLSETTLPGYIASAWSCTGGTQNGSSITLASGESAMCTITNNDVPAHLTLAKVVVNNNGGTAVATNFTLSAVGPTPISGPGSVSQDVNPGTYTLSETGVAGYTAGAWSCTGATLNGTSVSLAAGQSATCTITNDDQPAHLTVIKHVVNNNGGSALASAWTMKVTAGHPSSAAFPGSESGTTITLDAGSFSVAESGGPSQYAQTSAVGCVGALAPGQSATCTFTNDDLPPPPCSSSIGDFVWEDVNRNGLQDPGEPGIANRVVTLKNASGVVVDTRTTSASGLYQFAGLCQGAYSVEVATPIGYDETGRGVGSNPAADSNGSPAAVTLASNSTNLTIDFGFVKGFCEKQPVQQVLSGTQFPSNHGPDVVVRTQKGDNVQAAVDAASDTNNDGYIIVGVIGNDGGVLGGHVTQQVAITRAFTKAFALIGCSVTLHDPNPGDGNPTGRITSAASAPADGIGAKIFIMDVHAEDSSVAGWLIEGNNRYVRNTYGRHNLVGVKIVGNSNTMHNGSVDENTGAGLVVQGNNNLVTDTNAMENGGHGVQVTGSANQILKVDAGDKNTGNGGDGVHVEGAGNLVEEADAFGNGGDGIEVVAAAGSPNILKKNRSGDKGGKGNGGNGILVAGPGNGTANPIELEQNTVKANGLVGIRIIGAGHQLKNNLSGGSASGETNVGCEFNAVAGNINATGNKSNGTTVAGANGSAFPTGCLGSQ